jgi:Zn-dependent M28 family amino/carboxypeptidase
VSDGSVAAIVADVSPQRLRADVDLLAAFGTRHSLSSITDPARGIGAARRWLHDTFAAIGGESGRTGAEALRIDLDAHVVEPGPRAPDGAEIVNVVCEIPGAMPEAAGRLYYAVAHYDTRATDIMDADSDAPGANDDGSGTAALLELARVLAPRRFDATIVLLAVAGEEQALFGSRGHAAAARGAHRDLRMVLGADMIGDPTGPAGQCTDDRVRVFSEGLPRALEEQAFRAAAARGEASDGPSRQVARYVADVARRESTAVQPQLVFRNDRFLRGGDHTSFVEQGFAGVRLTELHESYDRQHQDVRVEDGRSYGDLPEHVDATYLAGVTRLMAAVLAHAARAPSSPPDTRLVVSGLAYDSTLRWSPCPEPDTAGYEVVRRATTAPDWEHVHDVGDVTEATLPFTRDDWLFGVRAYDREGYRSPVAYPSVARS